MTIDGIAEELHIMQLSDSFFPTGLFATSNGLETLFFDKKISTASELMELNKIMIEQQLGPSECVILANIHEFATSSEFDKIKELDSICYSLRTNRESREASVRTGNQLVRCVREFSESNVLNWYNDSLRNGEIVGTYTTAFGICCNSLHISKEKTLMMFLYGFLVSNVGAALRLGMIQHFEGQKIIHQLKPLITKTVKENSDKLPSDIWQFAPQIEIFQMQHETMDSRMFVT